MKPTKASPTAGPEGQQSKAGHSSLFPHLPVGMEGIVGLEMGKTYLYVYLVIRGTVDRPI